ncbi:hypothetical protein RA29_20665 [Tateyamaria sp. ANG-S1]|nr:hypothetical protein RA29_20665 [Tateyamaria sp. ANG-S1]
MRSNAHDRAKHGTKPAEDVAGMFNSTACDILIHCRPCDAAFVHPPVRRRAWDHSVLHSSVNNPNFANKIFFQGFPQQLCDRTKKSARRRNQVPLCLFRPINQIACVIKAHGKRLFGVHVLSGRQKSAACLVMLGWVGQIENNGGLRIIQ